MIKVAIEKGALVGGDVVRGIGFHTSTIVKYLRKFSDLNIDAVDFSETDLSLYDIAHYPKFNPYFLTLPLVKKTKTVVTIHDLIYLVYPDRYPSGMKGKVRFQTQKQLIKNVDAIITISETSKKDIIEYLHVDEELIHVVYLAARDMFKPIQNEKVLNKIKIKYNLPDNFVLYVGDVNYNKNIMVLADSCRIANIPLVIVGKQAVNTDVDRSHPENEPFVKFLDKYKDDENIIRTGFMPDDELVGIYNLATTYCQPSFYEGFGLPILEAFASKIPVVASRISAHKEIAGDAVIYCNPKSAKDMSKNLKRVTSSLSLRKKMVEKGSKQVRKYSWKKAAEETYEVYKRIASS